MPRELSVVSSAPSIVLCFLMLGTSTATDTNDKKFLDKGTSCTQGRPKYCPYYGTCCRISQYCSHKSRSCEPCYPTSLTKSELFRKCCDNGLHAVSWMAHETCTYACLDHFTVTEFNACTNGTDLNKSNFTDIDCSEARLGNEQEEHSDVFMTLFIIFGVICVCLGGALVYKCSGDKLKLSKLKSLIACCKPKSTTADTVQGDDVVAITCVNDGEKVNDTAMGGADGCRDRDNDEHDSKHKPLSLNIASSDENGASETTNCLQDIPSVNPRPKKKLKDPSTRGLRVEAKELPTDEMTGLLNVTAGSENGELNNTL